MIIISIRLSDEEKSALQKHGKISKVLREAIRAYLDSKKANKVLEKLERYQKANPVKTSTEEIVAMIREDRHGH